jgi:hypothetical protein
MAEKRTVFISYAHKDGQEFAVRLLEDLQQAGHSVWLDAIRLKGGASWTKEIEISVDNCSALLALLTPGSYFSEVCRAEQMRALRKGKRVIPVLVEITADKGLHLETLKYVDFSKDNAYRESFQQLLNLLDGSSLEVPTVHRKYLSTIVTAPPLPPSFVPRPEELANLRHAVTCDQTRRHVALVAVRGMGGVGKTVLAKALCHDRLIAEAFPDGVIWVEIGREAVDLVEKMKLVGDVLGDPLHHYFSEDSSKNRLRYILPKKAALIVLDDVWDKRHVEAFCVEGSPSRILFTSRDFAIGLSLEAQQVKLGTLKSTQAIQLLRNWAGRDDPNFPKIAARVGFLPQALRLAGARLRGGLTSTSWLGNFQHVAQMKLRYGANTREENLEASFDMSTDRLSNETRLLYFALSVFPEDVPIPEVAVMRLWRCLNPQLTQFGCHEVLNELLSLALLEKEGDKVFLHDLLKDYAFKKLTGTSVIHNAVVTAYGTINRSWTNLQYDDYFFRHARRHFVGAGRAEEFRGLLLNFDWLQAKLNATDDVSALLSDFSGVDTRDEDLSLLRTAIELAAPALALDKAQLAGQLLGRLPSIKSPRIQALLRQARHWRGAASLRPLTQSLTSPALVTRAKGPQTEYFSALALTPDARRAVSSFSDQSLKQWNLETCTEELPLESNKESVWKLATTQDCKSVLAAFKGNTVALFDLQSGVAVRTFHFDLGLVLALALSPDGSHAVSVSQLSKVKFVDLNRGIETRSFNGEWGFIWAAAISSDGRRALLGLHDCTVRLVSLESGEELHVFTGHRHVIRAISMTPDGRWGITASADTTVRLWDLERFENGCTLQGHTEAVRAVAGTADGRLAVSVSGDCTLRVWDLRQGREVASFTADAELDVCAISDDKLTIVAGDRSGRLHFLRVHDLRF